jgi:kynurenine formamidase
MAENKYDGNGSRSPQWWPSRYGADDKIGAGNEITPERTMEALKLPKEGKIIRLAQELHQGAPGYGLRKYNHIILAHETLHETRMGPNGAEMTAFEEFATSTFHIGCHLDGLGHVGINGRFYNGAHYPDFYTPGGHKLYGSETMPQWVTRGVMLDVCAVENTEQLPAGFEVTPAHLEAAEERQGVKVEAGDAVLVHTGWSANYDTPDDYVGREPGPGWDASHWLTDRNVSVVGADNWGFEVYPAEEEKPFVCHQHLLAETGTYILENVDTRPLVADNHNEFLWIMTPLRNRGATGSWVSPIAVV